MRDFQFSRHLAFIAMVGVANPQIAWSQDRDCLRPEIVKDPDLTKLPDGQALLEGLQTPYGNARVREIRFDFTEAEEIVRVTQTFTVDFSEIIKRIEATSFREAKKSENCNTSVTPKGFSLSPDAMGNLTGGLSIDTTFRGCQIFDVPCHKGGFEFGMCRVTWKEDIDSHTFGVDITLKRAFYSNEERQLAYDAARENFKAEAAEIDSITDLSAKLPRIMELERKISELAEKKICENTTYIDRPSKIDYEENVKLCGESKFNERGYTVHSPVKNYLLNLIGVVTLNIGSKFILDTYRSKLSDAHSAIDKAFSANLPSSRDLIGGNSVSDAFLKTMKIKTKTTVFKTIQDTEPYVALQYISEHPTEQGVRKRTFCRMVRPVVAQYGALLRSTTGGDQYITLHQNESLWEVSERTYGSGHYYLALLPANDIPFNNADVLEPGRRITLPAMYKIFYSSDRVVKMGESLWAVARNELGRGELYKGIAASNKKYIDNPDLIYPIQLLLIERAPAE